MMETPNSQSNPYRSPHPTVPVEEVETNGLDSELNRAHYASTYGLLFFPVLAQLLCFYILIGLSRRRHEFTQLQKVRFRTTCWINTGVTLILLTIWICVITNSIFDAPIKKAEFY